RQRRDGEVASQEPVQQARGGLAQARRLARPHAGLPELHGLNLRRARCRAGPQWAVAVTGAAMRPAIERLQGSLIREIANAGIGRPDVLAFWFGESDEVTPALIRRAAIESLERGETFYSQNLGLPELRAALADYTSAL